VLASGERFLAGLSHGRRQEGKRGHKSPLVHEDTTVRTALIPS
jgi:hypothetical protein